MCVDRGRLCVHWCGAEPRGKRGEQVESQVRNLGVLFKGVCVCGRVGGQRAERV